MPVVALAAGIAGLVALLLLLAAPIIVKLLQKVVPNLGIPTTGINLRTYAVNAMNAAATGLASVLDYALVPIGFVLQGIALTIWWVAGVITNAILEALAVGVSASAGLAQTLHTAETYADHAALGAIHDAQHLYNLAISHADAAALGAIHDAQHLYNLAVAAAQAGALGAVHDAEHLYNLSVAHADALAATLGADISTVRQLLVGDVTGAISQLEAAIAAAAAQATAEVNKAVTTAEAVAAQLATAAATTSLGGLEAAAHDAVLGPWLALLPVIQPLIADLPAEVAAGLGLPDVLPTSLPASIPAILGLTIPLVGALTTEIDRCLLGRCDAIGEVNQVFQALKGLGLAALLAALVGEAVNDPHAAADAIVDAGSWVDGVVTGMVDAILG